MKSLKILSLLAAAFCLSQANAEVLFDFGTDGNTFGVFGNGTETIGATSVLAEGSGGSFPIMLGASRGAFDFAALPSDYDIVITGLKDTNGTTTVTNASLRFVDAGFNLVARWNFDLTSLPTSEGQTIVGTVGAPDVTGGGDANAVTAIVFQAESGTAGTWDFTINNVAAIPEPSTYAGMAGTLVLAVIMLRRRLRA